MSDRGQRSRSKVIHILSKKYNNQNRQFHLFEFCLKIDNFAILHLLLPKTKAFLKKRTTVIRTLTENPPQS